MKRLGFKNKRKTPLKSKWMTRNKFARFSSLRSKGPSAFWMARSLECRKRDGFRCRRCGVAENKSKNLGAAHIIGLGSRGRRDDPECPLNELRNLITLCHLPVGRDCHSGHDQRGEWAWAAIGVFPDPELARKYGYRERKTC